MFFSNLCCFSARETHQMHFLFSCSSCLYLSIFVWHSDISYDRKSPNRPISFRRLHFASLFTSALVCWLSELSNSLFSSIQVCDADGGRENQRDTHSPDNNRSRQSAWGQLLSLDTTEWEIQNDWSYFRVVVICRRRQEKEKRTQIPLVETKREEERSDSNQRQMCFCCTNRNHEYLFFPDDEYSGTLRRDTFFSLSTYREPFLWFEGRVGCISAKG